VPRFSTIAAVLDMRAARERRAVEVGGGRRSSDTTMPSPTGASAPWWNFAPSRILAGDGRGESRVARRADASCSLTGSSERTPSAALLIRACPFGRPRYFVQGWRSVLVIVLFALGFQTIVWASGSL
jgi:hypothetical protein